jgi:hypothetical protein
MAGKAKHQQPAQVDRGDPHRPPHLAALDSGMGLIVWRWPAARRAARVCPEPLWVSPSTSNPGSSPASSPTPVGPSGPLAAVGAHSVTSPLSGSAAMWPL